MKKLEEVINDKLCVIIRTMPGREQYLDKCLFILSGQNYENIEPIVVVQKLSEDSSNKEIKFCIDRWRSCFNQIKLLEFTSSSDARSHSLNLGLNACDGRFIAFLDDDDKVYPNHYTNLINEIVNNKVAWGYADVIVGKYNKFGQLVSREVFCHNNFSFLTLLNNNYIPINSFVLDKYKIRTIGLFDESLSKFEDYLFLLNIARKFEPYHSQIASAEYCQRTDGSNTIAQITDDEKTYKIKKNEWDKALEYVNRKKAEQFGWWVKELNESAIFNNTLSNNLSINPQNELKAIYSSLTWKIVNFLSNINRIIRHRPVKPLILPRTDNEAVFQLIRLYSKGIWLLFSPLYLIETCIHKK